MGGNISAQSLLNAYRNGFYPLPTDDPDTAEENEVRYSDLVDSGNIRIMPTEHPLGPYATRWWNPDSRPVIAPNEAHLSKTLRRLLRNTYDWTTTADTAFAQVVDACAAERQPPWLTGSLKTALLELHEQGWAHSVEVWSGAELIAGVFGIAFGSVFSIDSTFHTVNDAGKIAFADAQDRLSGNPGVLLDLQWPQHYLGSLGAHWKSRTEYLGTVGDIDARVAFSTDRRPAARLAPAAVSVPRSKQSGKN
ncbi:leucyl/phenylalanyl-tRNA--protein transferase [Kitasatospora viridis]|uniref:Leucyl/phenylalanyl-tRNA--protein transferase n=2 Tax=Kitasatospora viridis TaxID=281105 RepID=A0A561UMZ7_9ACTN|nr:leucyl/phenylalanyl-tRNA--protein transferase [Kitasatospora viridis]